MWYAHNTNGTRVMVGPYAKIRTQKDRCFLKKIQMPLDTMKILNILSGTLKVGNIENPCYKSFQIKIVNPFRLNVGNFE